MAARNGAQGQTGSGQPAVIDPGGAPLQGATGNAPNLEEVLPQIKDLALKVGGLKNLAAIIAELQETD